jgi:NTE family protein
MAAPLALVLSGGGSKGAFQVGFMEELILNRGVDVGIFGGVSTGSIQALGGAQGEVARLRDIWLGIEGPRDIYRKRFGGIIGGVLGGADSLNDAAPIRAKIKDFANPAKLASSGKRLVVGVVSLTTGGFRIVDQTAPDIADWVYASSAVPVAFQPLKRRDAAGVIEKWVDGGVRNITPLDAVMELAPRGIIAVLASPLVDDESSGDSDYSNLLEIGMRSAGILANEVFVNDVRNADLINDLLLARDDQLLSLAASGLDPPAIDRIIAPFDAVIAKYRFVPVVLIAPTERFSKSLDFDPAKIRTAMAAGRQAVADNWARLAPLIGPVVA